MTWLQVVFCNAQTHGQKGFDDDCAIRGRLDFPAELPHWDVAEVLSRKVAHNLRTAPGDKRERMQMLHGLCLEASGPHEAGAVEAAEAVS